MQEAGLFLFLVKRKSSLIHSEYIKNCFQYNICIYFAIENYLNRKYISLVNEPEEIKDERFLGKGQLWHTTSV